MKSCASSWSHHVKAPIIFVVVTLCFVIGELVLENGYIGALHMSRLARHNNNNNNNNDHYYPLTDGAKPRCRLYWRGGRLHGNDPVLCTTAEPPRTIDRNVLFVGDSVTRYLYFGLVQTMCAHRACPGLPWGGIAKQQVCSTHTTTDHTTNHTIRYVRETYGADPREVVAAEATTTTPEIVYWQTGLWMKTKGLSVGAMRSEYASVIRAALELCRTGVVRHFFLAETLSNPGGMQGNAGADNMNAALHDRYATLVPREEDGTCLHLQTQTWPTRDWEHISGDRLHPSIDATVFFGGAVWAALAHGGGDYLVHDDTVLDSRHPDLRGDWCPKAVQYLSAS